MPRSVAIHLKCLAHLFVTFIEEMTNICESQEATTFRKSAGINHHKLISDNSRRSKAPPPSLHLRSAYHTNSHSVSRGLE